MGWLTFKFCVLIWILCVSKLQSQIINASKSTDNQLRSTCTNGEYVEPPDQCNTCICFDGLVYCSNLPCPEKECINGIELPQLDECNKCICRRGKVTCSNMICIPAPLCTENQLYPAQNKCNACMCKGGFITCTSNVCPEELLTTTTTTRKPKKKKKCKEGSRLPGPNECLSCICQNGSRKCKYVCNPIVESRFQAGPECYRGQHLPGLDDCNNCICFEGQVHCTHLPCRSNTRITPECSDDQPVYRPDECNVCYCFEGRLQCSDLVCIRGSKCVDGQVIPNPDGCNSCKCVEGHIICTNKQCNIPISRNLLSERSSKEVIPLGECQEGDFIPPPPPPNDCNTCYCMDKHIVCTMNTCEALPEFKGRLKEINEKVKLEMFDKKILVEPFIHILYSNNDKMPRKLIHSHTYNGFHQEIKVHASHLPNDTNTLLKVLATSLDNAALASISQKLLTPNSVLNRHDLKKPFDHSGNQANQLGEQNVLSAQTSKLITSGSQSKETIVVIPHTEPFGDQNSESVLPLESKHETAWKTVTSPDTLVYNNDKQIFPRQSQEENVKEHTYGSPLLMITPNDQDLIIRNPSKFGRPGQAHVLSMNPTRNTENTPSLNTQSINPKMHPKPLNTNHGKMMYTSFIQENKPVNPAPTLFAVIRDELPQLRPNQPTQPGPNQNSQYTSPAPVFRPQQYILDRDSNVGHQKPSQYQFLPNPNNYSNKGTPQHSHFKLMPIPTLPIHKYYNKGVPLQPLTPKQQNQPIVPANRYKPMQYRFQYAPGSISPLNIMSNTQFKPYSNNIHLNPPIKNQPNKKNRISPTDNLSSQKITPRPQFSPNSAAHHPDILNPPQNQVKSHLMPNPSIYYKNEYEAPKIIEENPGQDQSTPYSVTSYKNDQPPSFSEPAHEKLTPKVHNKAKKYNTPDDPIDIPKDHYSPPIDVTEHLSDEDSQELDLSKKVDYNLNLPNLYKDQSEHRHPSEQRQNNTQIHSKMAKTNKYNQHDPWSKNNEQFEGYPHSPNESKQIEIQTDQNGTFSNSPINFAIHLHKAPKRQLVIPQDSPEKEDLNYLESAKGSQSPSSSAEGPEHPKSKDHLSPPDIEPPQNQLTPGMFDERGSADGFQYPFKSAEDITPQKVKINESPHFVSYKSMLNPQQPKGNGHIPPYSQLGDSQNPHKLEVLENPRDKDIFQYGHNANDGHKQMKPFHKLPPFSPAPTNDKQTPGMFDQRGSPEGFRYPSYLNENPLYSRGKLHNPTLNRIGPGKKSLAAVFDDVGSTDGFHYPSKSLLPKDRLNEPLIKSGATQNLQLPGKLDDRGSTGGLQNPSYSTDNSLFPFPKDNNQNLPHPKPNPRLPGMFDGSKSPEFPYRPKNNLYEPQNSPFRPTQKQKLPGVSDDRGSADGFHSPTNSTDKPIHPNYNIYTPNSPFRPTITQKPHLPGIFDDRGSVDGLDNPSNTAISPLHPKYNEHKSSSSLYPSNSAKVPKHLNLNKPTLIQYPFDSVGNPKQPEVPKKHGFQYPLYLAKNPTTPKQHKEILPNSPFSSTQNQHKPREFDNRGSLDGFQYPLYSGKNPNLPKQNEQILPNSKFAPTQNQHKPGEFDNRGSPHGSHYPLYSGKNLTLLKPNEQKLPNYPFSSTQNQHKPGEFNNRGSPHGSHYPHYSGKNPTLLKPNEQKLPNSPFSPTQNQHKPGEFDNHGNPHGSHYPLYSGKNPTLPKPNEQILPNSPFASTQNKHFPEMFDERGSLNGFQYQSHSPKNSLQPKGNQQNPSQPNMGPVQNQHTPGVFDDRGSADGFQYPSNSAENPLQPKRNKQNSPYPQSSPNRNQHSPGSTDGFQYPSNSAQNPLQPKSNKHNPPYPQSSPNQNQHTPGVFDDRGSADGFQYPPNSAENPLQPKSNKQNSPYPQSSPNQNQHSPGVFDDRGSGDGFQYPSNSAKKPLQLKSHKQNSPYPQSSPNQNQHSLGVFDDRGSADGFQYPPNSAENPLQPKSNQQNSPYPQSSPNQNQHSPGVFDDRGSADGLQYPSNSAENPLQPKRNKQNPPYPQSSPNQNQYSPGVFDDRGAADGFQYPSNSAQNPLQPKSNKQNPPYLQSSPNQNQHSPGVFDDRGSGDGFQYPSNSAKNPLQLKSHKQNSPYPQSSPNQNQHSPGVFDDRGSADGFQYPSNSAENPLQPKCNKQNPPYPQSSPNQNQHNPGSADGLQYPSNSAQNPLQPKSNKQNSPYPQSSPNQNQHTPGVFNDRGPADGFQYSSKSAEDPIFPKDNPDTTLEFIEHSQNLSQPLSLDQDPQNIPTNYSDKTENKPTSNNYDDKNSFTPWKYLDHDQHKPSIFDNLLDGDHNFPWAAPEDDDKAEYTGSSTRTPRFEPDYDQYKPSFLNNLFNGIHHIPRPIGSHPEFTTPLSDFKPEQDPYTHTDLLVFDKDDDDPHLVKNSSPDLIKKNTNHVMTVKPDSVADSLLPTDDGKIPDYYDHLYPLLIALKKLSEPTNDDSGMDSVDTLDLLPILFPAITEILKHNSSEDHEAPVDHLIQSIFPFNKLKSKLNQLPNNDNSIPNWLNSQPNILSPIKKNTSESYNDIDLPKILDLLSKLATNRIKQSSENIPFNGFDPEIIDKITNDFKEDPHHTATSTPHTDATTDAYDNRFISVPTTLEETKKYPEVHTIVQKPDDEDHVDLPSYIGADGKASLSADMDSEEIHYPLFPNMFHPRFRHRSKDHKDECGDGTQWISNCYTCSCYFGQPLCLKMHDCELRTFGEPMICKPYSQFKMGCYTCECDGDGVADCDATDCGTEPKEKSKVSGPHDVSPPIFREFVNDKKTDEIMKYYKSYKKLPKDCPSQDSETEYPTCARGTSWISSCHNCECNESGKHECKKIEGCVLDFESYGKPGQCKPNSKYYPKTNTMPCVECSCNDEGISYCPDADHKKR